MQIKHENGVVYYTSDKIKVPHAFATRLGGVSKAPHTSTLNLAYGRGDDEETIKANLRRFAEAVGFAPESVCSLPQIHSSKVIYVSRDMCGQGYFTPPSTQCDGYVTHERGVTLGVKTADCVPILLADEKNGVIAALHAGWRGTFSDICGEGVRQMCMHGAKKESIVAVIGPSICKKCYEVGRDVYDAAISCIGEDALRFFEEKSESGKYLVDIKGANRYLLERAGVNCRNIEILPLCTYEHPELFWSHRYTKGERGTMMSVITL